MDYHFVFATGGAIVSADDELLLQVKFYLDPCSGSLPGLVPEAKR